MKLLILSDIHLEFAPFNPVDVDYDVAVIAGDFYVGSGTIAKIASRFAGKPIIFVPGNHEYYGTLMSSHALEMREDALKMGIHYLDNNEVTIDGVRFIGSTLWTDFELFGEEQKQFAMMQAGEDMNDFDLIRYGSLAGRYTPNKEVNMHRESVRYLESRLAHRFTPEDSIELHRAGVEYLETRLAQPFAGKTVVVTHHLPHRNSVAPEYSGDIMSAAFASDLSRMMGKSNLWIHGHTHNSFDYEVDGTRVVCNPRGYHRRTGKFENPDFNPKLVIEV